ncbi:MAG: heme-dependent peroxidase [Alicyclobacillaceae bacterium]|nr:heme-dependent peroxidase [Alicyclobacillaceae bacterium]MCY0895456.1 heme-dependent peroxidase [Alicyclobacillaceae bacterium]
MPEAPQTLDGWYVLHDFRTLDVKAWQSASAAERTEAWGSLEELLLQYDAINSTSQGSFGFYQMAGHKADVLFLHFRPTVAELIDVKTKLQKTSMAPYLQSPYSYVSVVELGGYLAKPGVDVETDEYLQSRLKPRIPEMDQICFYPMSKRRDGQDNWYMLPTEDRAKLMRSHGMIGRTYAEKVKQIISGSMGLDDWEWGVTLFAHDPLEFKKIVQEMRFDEVSARFADFGVFLVGCRVKVEDAKRSWDIL